MTDESNTPYAYLEKAPQPDIGVIEVSLALAAVSALFTASALPLFVRIFALAAFLFSSYGAGRMFYTYVLFKLPSVFEVSYYSKFGVLALVPYFVKLVIQNMPDNLRHPVGANLQEIQESIRIRDEVGLLSILAGFFLMWVAALGWIAVSFLR